MKTEAYQASLLCLVFAACGDPIATLELALEAPPARIATISVFAIDAEEDRVVATTTVTRLSSLIPLGVPAERPLELHVLARPALPEPSSVGPMPAYVGMAEATVPLGSSRRRIAITARPSGVLTVLASPRAANLGEDTRHVLRSAGVERRLLVPAGVERYAAHLALPAGEVELESLGSDGAPAPSIVRGLYVPIEGESTTRLELARSAPSASVSALRLEAWDETEQRYDRIDRITVASGSPLPFGFRARAVDESGRPLADDQLRLDWRLRAWPGPVEREGAGRGGELEVRALELGAVNRIQLIVWVEDWAQVRDQLLINVLPPGVEPGAVEVLSLELDQVSQISAGTWLSLQLIDAAGYFVHEVAGRVSLDGSDPWVYVNRERRAIEVEGMSTWIARPSAPSDGSPVFLRAHVELPTGELETELELAPLE